MSSSKLKIHLMEFLFFHSAHYLGYFLHPVHTLKFLWESALCKWVVRHWMHASPHLPDTRELGPEGSAFVSAEPPNSPSTQTPWRSAALAPPAPRVSRTRRVCSRWQPESHKCLSAEQRGASPPGRVRPSSQAPEGAATALVLGSYLGVTRSCSGGPGAP